jgi:hypothetical protein
MLLFSPLSVPFHRCHIIIFTYTWPVAERQTGKDCELSKKNQAGVNYSLFSLSIVNLQLKENATESKYVKLQRLTNASTHIGCSATANRQLPKQFPTWQPWWL